MSVGDQYEVIAKKENRRRSQVSNFSKILSLSLLWLIMEMISKLFKIFSALFHRNVYFQLCVRLTFCQIRSHSSIVRKYINFSNGFLFDHSFRKSNGIIRRMKIIKCGIKENNNFSPFSGSLGHSVVWLSWRFIVSHLLVIILYSNEIHFFAITSWFWWFRLFKTSKIIE